VGAAVKIGIVDRTRRQLEGRVSVGVTLYVVIRRFTMSLNHTRTLDASKYRLDLEVDGGSGR